METDDAQMVTTVKEVDGMVTITAYMAPADWEPPDDWEQANSASFPSGSMPSMGGPMMPAINTRLA